MQPNDFSKAIAATPLREAARTSTGQNLVDAVAEHVGRVQETIETSNLSRGEKRFVEGWGPGKTTEFNRVTSLPRRDWHTDPTIDAAIEGLHEMLRLPGGDKPCDGSWCAAPKKIGCLCPRALWREQAAALIEMCTIGGAFCPIGVGKGKGLLSILAPVILGAKRPVLLVPAPLRPQTTQYLIPLAARRWRLHPNLRVVGYSELSIISGKELLFNLEPDLIIADESHSIKNASSTRTKRLKEYFKECPTTKFVPLSGSATKRSLLDYWQHLVWALGEERSPLPSEWSQAKIWANALDEKPIKPCPPGALVLWTGGSTEPADVREAYRKRLTETPGVVASGDTELAMSLVIQRARVDVPTEVRRLIQKMNIDWCTPDGMEFNEAIDLWRHSRELACGYYNIWDPAAPEAWREARAAWTKWSRDRIRTNRQRLDSELVLSNYLTHTPPAELPKVDKLGLELLEAWRAVRGSFEPNTTAVWISDFAVDAAWKWLEESVDKQNPHGGIAWVDSIAFGQRLAEIARVPYFGAGAKASQEILAYRGPMVASIQSHGEGKNLQHYSRALVCTPPASGKTWEQLLGRLHRPGQSADEVDFGVWLHAEGLEDSVAQAIRDALYIEQTLGIRQKLSYCDKIDIALDLETTRKAVNRRGDDDEDQA